MFCKWCGTTLDPADRSCRKCGREIPPLSDCGGFYDLVGGVRQNRPTGAQPQQPPRVDLSGVEEQIKRVAGHSRRELRRLRVTVFCGFGLLLILIAALLIQNVLLQGQVTALEKAGLTQPQEAEPSTVPEEMDFSRDEISIYASLSPENTLDLGEYKDSFDTLSVLYDREEGRLVRHVVLTTLQGGEALTAQIDCAMEDGYVVYVLQFTAQPEFFGDSAEIQCQWEIRFGEGEWTLLEAEAFIPESGDYGAGGRCSVAQAPELRCTITRKSHQGGSLTLKLDDIEP